MVRYLGMDFQISIKEPAGTGLRRILLNELKAARCELQGRGEGCTGRTMIGARAALVAVLALCWFSCGMVFGAWVVMVTADIGDSASALVCSVSGGDR